jgi:hypothetical protein
VTSFEATASERLPTSAWVLGWSSVVLQVLRLADRGFTGSGPLLGLLSMTLTAVVVAWFAEGVLRARRVRAAVVSVLLLTGVLLQVAGILQGMAGPGALLQLVAAAVQLVALAAFCRSGYFRAQRAGRRRAGPEVGSLVALAVVAGALGGLAAPPEGDAPTQLRVGL